MRSALLPDVESSADSPTEALHVPALVSASYPTHGSGSSDDTTVATYTLRSSQLNKIQRHLLRGDRRAAYQYAADERLWAHAMVIASSVDKEAWKEVVTEFLRAELSSSGAAHHSLDGKGSQANGREPLKVAYSLFAGQGPASGKRLSSQLCTGRPDAMGIQFKSYFLRDLLLRCSPYMHSLPRLEPLPRCPRISLQRYLVYSFQRIFWPSGRRQWV